MNWKDLHPRLIASGKETCRNFALACCDKGLFFTDNEYVVETVFYIKENMNDKRGIDSRFGIISGIRKTATDINRRESAHIVLHMIELSSSNSVQSMAGHAARCAEALSRIDEDAANEVINVFSI